jgi:hypothetical protein
MHFCPSFVRLSHFAPIQEPANLFFTAAFTLELLLNLYAHWLRPFFTDACAPAPSPLLPVSAAPGPSIGRAGTQRAERTAGVQN